MIQVSAQPLGMVSNCTALLDGFFSIAASTMSTLETILLLNTCHSRFPLLVNIFYMKLQSQNCACTRQNLSINFTFWHKHFSLKSYYCTNVCLFFLSTTLCQTFFVFLHECVRSSFDWIWVLYDLWVKVQNLRDNTSLSRYFCHSSVSLQTLHRCTNHTCSSYIHYIFLRVSVPTTAHATVNNLATHCIHLKS